MSVGNPPVTSTPEQLALDDKPLKFGKFKGRTPNELYEEGESSYIVWMYKTVENFDTCSPTLERLAQNDLDAQKNKKVLSRERPPIGASKRDSGFPPADWYKEDDYDDEDDIPL